MRGRTGLAQQEHDKLMSKILTLTTIPAGVGGKSLEQGHVLVRKILPRYAIIQNAGCRQIQVLMAHLPEHGNAFGTGLNLTSGASTSSVRTVSYMAGNENLRKPLTVRLKRERDRRIAFLTAFETNADFVEHMHRKHFRLSVRRMRLLLET